MTEPPPHSIPLPDEFPVAWEQPAQALAFWKRETCTLPAR